MRKYYDALFSYRASGVWSLILGLALLLIFLPARTEAAGTYAQETKLNLNRKGISIKEAIETIEKSTEFYFFLKYDGAVLNKKIDVNFKDATIYTVLKGLLKGTNLTYKIVDKYVAIVPKNEAVKAPQDRTLKGKVTDKKGEGLPGVSVGIKGTAIGVVTDLEGKYALKLPLGAETIQFTFVGMKTQEVALGNRSVIDVVLEEDLIGLDEVVVVGYGVVKKSDLTGAVASVKADELPEAATTSVMHMLSGKVAGLQVQQNSAQPGGGVSVLIRGAASTGAGNSPLYIIDGFPVNTSNVEPDGGYSYGSRNPLNAINPNDIESIEVLKDASATAIYGARAANGVVLITTKNAEKGSLEIGYDFRFGVQESKNDWNLLNAQELMRVRNHGYREYYRYQNNFHPYGDKGEVPDGDFPGLFTEEEIQNAENFDYVDMITRTGKIVEHNVTLKSGTDKTKIFTSFNYFDQEGLVKNLDLTRYSGRINMDQELAKNLTFGIRTTGSLIQNANSQMGGINDGSGMISSAFQFPTFIAPKDAEGNYNLNPERPTIPNPVSFMEVTDNTNTYKLLTSADIQYQVTDWLGLKAKYGIDYNMGKRKRYLPKSFLYGANQKGFGSISQIERYNHLFELTASFNKEIGQLALSGVAGYSEEEFNFESQYLDNNDFITDQFLYNNLGSGQADRPGVKSEKSLTRFRSYFGRLNLNWKSRYLLTLTMRADGSDRFGENNKWGYFPSAALAWRVIEEDFMKDQGIFSDLKVRTSYGQIGNSNIGGNAFAYYSVGSSYGFGNKIVKGVEQTSLANPDLKWETTTEVNLGIDIGLFDDRVYATFEVYRKTVDDLLSKRTLASYLPINQVAANIGSTQSQGWELTLNTQNLKGELEWNTSVTLGHYEDRWKTRNPEVILKVYESEDDPLGAKFGYLSDGLVAIGEEFGPNPGLIPGEIKVKDINGLDEDGNLTGEPDGKINDADRVLLGTSRPDLNIGITNNFKYKNFDLSIYMYGSLDRDRYDDNMRNLGILQRENNSNDLTYDAWSSENLGGTLPSGIKTTYSGNSDFYRTNVDFIRLKNITLGYTFNDLLSGSRLVKSARMFVDMNNVAVFSNYDTGDPETDSWAAYPFPFTVTVGASIQF
ncbi:SusC/RagA family TonB-linked outer membrane protein [Fulvitalea axinellae]|uniref:SusC/RagA family TonB-linked outer membrane protein n=1 Tax=Fulvitalea axinellae TaxID=1182444 RepID=A0AAU9CRG5_9BACT|nr:SusC/RagA family TonB-linked outer membrane protein [Fulvitalea axinellae]